MKNSEEWNPHEYSVHVSAFDDSLGSYLTA
jgi:hypothetical protein